MSKYDPLKRHLSRRSENVWRTTFPEIEAVLGFTLPPTAYRRAEFWANNPEGHSHARAWLAAGWRTSDVKVQAATLTFRRDPSPAPGFAEQEAATYVADGTRSRPDVPARLTIRGLDYATMARLESKAELSGKTVEAVAREILTRGARLTPEEKHATYNKMRAMLPPLGDADIPALVRAGRDDEFDPE